MDRWRTPAELWLRRHRQGVLDVGLALGLLAWAVATPWPHVDVGLAVLLGLFQVFPVALRRRAPLGSLAVMVAAGFVPALASNFRVGPPMAAMVAIIFGIYSVAAYRPRAVSVPVLVGWLLIIALVAASIPATWDFGAAVGYGIVFAVLPAVGAWIGGDVMQRRRNRARTLAAEAARDGLEREEAARREMSEERARQAAAAERARIARELHDVVAHNVSVMVVQAGAARRVLSKDPAEARKSIRSIESTGRQALSEMRRLLGVVRKPGRTIELAPQPGLEQIKSLVEKVREAGVQVSLEVEGTARALSPGLELSAYRIVQEALTNVVKHAQARHAAVRLVYGRDTLRIAVIDDGRGHVRFEGEPDAGFGLLGLRERVAVFGGEFESGNLSPGQPGYQVVATLPIPA